MSEHVESVKQVIADLRSWADRNRERDNGSVAVKMDGFIEALTPIEGELLRLYGLTSSLPADLGNVHDLPPELLEELSVAKADELEDQLVTVIRAYDDEASLDQILVGLWRKFKVSQKRRFIQNKLYRMDTVWSVSGRKGVYTTTEPEDKFMIDTGDPDQPPIDVREGPYDMDSEIPF